MALFGKKKDETSEEKGAREERLKALIAELDVLIQEEISFNVHKVAFADLESVEIAPSDLINLEPFIEFPPDSQDE